MLGRKIFVTGASGLVARFIIDRLSTCKVEVVAITNRTSVVNARYAKKNNISVLSWEELWRKSGSYFDGASLIHCAFTRENDGRKVAESMLLADKCFRFARNNNFEFVINISTRSVYVEPNEGCLNSENSPINALGGIATGKYASELLLGAYLENSQTKYTNLRLSSVNELKNDLTMIRPLNKFVESVILGKEINVIGGMQMMSFIDPRDVAESIVKLLETDKWRSVYNVGTGWMCTEPLIDMAHRVNTVGRKMGYNPVPINIEEKYVNQRAGLDINAISQDTGFQPRYTLDDMIESLYKMMDKK